MLYDIDEEARMKCILGVLDKTLQLALKIDEVVGRLSEKRVTLEEKMIRSYFHQVGANLLELSAWLNRALAAATTPKTAPNAGSAKATETSANGCKVVTRLTTEEIKVASLDLDQFLGRMESNVDELLRVLRYNLNYVEQYFEFNYYGKLTNEDGFLADSAELLKKFKDSVQ
jgi:hypothetical protein